MNPLAITKDELFEAEYKLQNCLRVTLNVESFTTEVNTGERYVPITNYVLALIDHIKKGGKT